jgi:hypothetical protein
MASMPSAMPITAKTAIQVLMMRALMIVPFLVRGHDVKRADGPLESYFPDSYD